MKARSAAFSVVAGLLLLGGVLPYIYAQQPPPPPANPEPEVSPSGDRVQLILDPTKQRPKIRLAFPPFRSGPGFAGAAAQAGREMEETVRQDLQSSGYFEIQGPNELRALPLSGDVQRDLPLFLNAGNEILLLGDLRSEGDRIVFEGRLFDIRSGEAILAKRYRGTTSVARRIGHTFADEVIRHLTGQRGIGLSTIAFTSDRSGHKEIYVMDYDGFGQQKVTGHQSTSMSPAWRPDGGALAYTSFFSGAPGIYLADLGSGRKRPLVSSGSLNTTPSFSPDGGRIVFARSVNGNVEIFVTPVGNESLRRLTHSNAIDTNPAWSPKGGEIAFTSGRAGNPHIYLMDAEGANQRRLTFEGDYNDGATWSPSGDLIAYTSRRGGRFQIAVTNVVTLATQVITSGAGENESPAFSPDGRKIAFTSRRGGTKQIYVIDVDGSNLRQLTREGNNDMPDWSRTVPEP
jgi:TolB protein